MWKYFSLQQQEDEKKAILISLYIFLAVFIKFVNLKFVNFKGK